MDGNRASGSRLVFYLTLEIRLGHFIRCPATKSARKSKIMTKSKPKKKKTYQQIAVLGIVEIIRGRAPRRNPPQPNCRLMIAAALISPLADRTSSFAARPRVCSSVLTTSRGVVIPAAKAPANPPAMQWVNGSYSCPGFMNLESDSYATNCVAVKGTVMQRVVG